MSANHTALVSKVWNYAHVLRDQGIGYGERYEVILTNPPLGNKSSYKVIGRTARASRAGSVSGGG